MMRERGLSPMDMRYPNSTELAAYTNCVAINPPIIIQSSTASRLFHIFTNIFPAIQSDPIKTDRPNPENLSDPYTETEPRGSIDPPFFPLPFNFKTCAKSLVCYVSLCTILSPFCPIPFPIYIRLQASPSPSSMDFRLYSLSLTFFQCQYRRGDTANVRSPPSSSLPPGENGGGGITVGQQFYFWVGCHRIGAKSVLQLLFLPPLFQAIKYANPTTL